jgi:hypothetical protein
MVGKVQGMRRRHEMKPGELQPPRSMLVSEFSPYGIKAQILITRGERQSSLP